MNDSVDRRPLAERVADAVATDLRGGKWPDGLPGYRIIAEHYSVSWRTSRGALQLLEQRGVLGPSTKGKVRRIQTVAGDHGSGSSVLLMVSSSKVPVDADELKLIDDMALAWTSMGGQVLRSQVDYGRVKSPESMLRRLVQNKAASVVVLREPSEAWAQAARRLSQPVYFLGGDIPPAELPQVSGIAFSVRQAVAAVAKRLRALGHERILVPDEGRGTEMRKAILDGLGATVGSEARPFPDERACPVFERIDPDAWQRYWEESLRRFRPTAVIVRKESSYLSFQGYCFRRGLQIPRDISVVSMSSGHQLRWCYPPPDYLSFPNRKALAHFRRWLKNGFPVTGMRLLPVEYVEGGSVRAIRPQARAR